MPHLGSFRKGWESENLARYILHKFSFVSHPSSVSDDIGSDFFCTLFEVQKEGGNDYLVPKNSFAIQVKSSSEKFDISNKLQYLENLEIPFFVGVVDRSELKMVIYSGEYIPFFFSYKGVPEKLEIELCERNQFDPFNSFCVETGYKSYVIKFPKVLEIRANVDTEELKQSVHTLSGLCFLIQENIASKKGGEYIFKLYGCDPPRVMIFAGSGSFKVFRENFLKRLAEVFCNLDWIFKNVPDEFKIEEFRIYENLYNQLNDIYGLPDYLTQSYDKLKVIIE